jgi:small subunit ribosomal protein S20
MPGKSLIQSAAVANIKSQIKRNRQNERRRVRNKAVRTQLKTSAKRVRTAAAEGNQSAQAELLKATRQLDQAASRGALHRRAAARRKSRLARAVRSASSSS